MTLLTLCKKRHGRQRRENHISHVSVESRFSVETGVDILRPTDSTIAGGELNSAIDFAKMLVGGMFSRRPGFVCFEA